MLEAQWEQKKKDQILQEINEELERQDWGGEYDRIVIKVILRGRFNLMPLEVDQKVKRKPIF